MQILKFLAAVVAAIFLQMVGVWLYPSFPRVLDLFLVVTVLTALRGHSAAGMTAGLIAGLTADTLSGGPYGLFGFLNTLVGYTTARVCQRLVIQQASQVFLLAAGAVLLQQALLAGLVTLLLDPRELPDLVWIPVKALACGLVAFFSVILSATLQTTRERRRRGRMERLRL